MLSKIINHARNREYMSGVERDNNRVKATGEVFTPTVLVQEILGQLPTELFTNPDKTYLDPSCGDGQFLSEVLIRKIENGSTFEQALSTIYGVDLMPDNVKLCQDRLLCGREDLRHIVEKNIVCADGLKYHYRFDGTPCDITETKEEKRARIIKERAQAKKQREREQLAKKKKLAAERKKKQAKLARDKAGKQAKLARARAKKQAIRDAGKFKRQQDRDAKKLARAQEKLKRQQARTIKKSIIQISDEDFLEVFEIKLLDLSNV